MSKHPVIHFEMPYEDRARLITFYNTVFGWNMVEYGEDMGNYVVAQTAETDDKGMIKTPGSINGGFAPKTEGHVAPSVVIHVDDIEASVKEVEAAGGTIFGELMDIPGIGRYVQFTDTEGNRASMLQPASRQ